MAAVKEEKKRLAEASAANRAALAARNIFGSPTQQQQPRNSQQLSVTNALPARGIQIPGTTQSAPLPEGHSQRGGRTRRRFKKKRLMSRKYCKKTPCRRMGFTQKASCRPYKNCYTRRK